MVNLAMIFDVTTLLNVTEFLPTAFWTFPPIVSYFP